MAINKAKRQEVFEKYNHHCAYCGCELEYKDMQVDHFIPKNGWNESGSDDISNLMPSCRKCNHYKRDHNIEEFRRLIYEIPKKLNRDSYIYRIGIKYGNIIDNTKPIKFYFEEYNNVK